MNYRNLFRPFKRKLLAESVLKAFFFAMTTGALSVFLVSFGYHIAIKQAPTKLLVLVFAIVFLMSFGGLFFTRLFPTKKRVAQRIDEIGLQERALTMLEYRKTDTEMAKLQRLDAEKCISQISPKSMKLKIQRREWILALASVCLAIAMLAIPYDILSFTVSESERIAEEQERIVKELIEQLREEVKEAELPKDVEEQLNEIIDELEKTLEESESELERAAEIEKAKEEMQKILEEQLTRKKIGAALQMYDLTKYLGEAISDGDTEAVSTELDNLEVMVNTYRGMIAVLSDNVTSALKDSGVDEGDELYDALNVFATYLKVSAVGVEQGEDVTSDLADTFKKAKEDIIAALETQSNIEEKVKEMQETLSEGKDEVLGNEEEEQEESEEEKEGEEQEGEQEEGQEQEGEQEGQQGQQPSEGEQQGQGQGQGEGEGEGNSMTEGMYDPTSGNVSYGEVFAAYYAEYLKALENGEISDELREIMDKYFSSLN